MRSAAEAHVLGEELPGEIHGLLLEVVAEGEVAQHLEEGVVARRPAHVLQVVVLAPGADALLAGGGARVVALLLAQEDVLELVHARVGEEEGRVPRGDEGGGAHHAVAPVLEVLQESRSDVVAGHGLPIKKRERGAGSWERGAGERETPLRFGISFLVP